MLSTREPHLLVPEPIEELGDRMLRRFRGDGSAASS